MKNFFKAIYIKLFTIVGLSSFTVVKDLGNMKYKSSYRVTGYYFIYTFSDGDRKLIPCPWLFANGIGGYGVCGAYVPFSEVHSINFSFKRWFFFKHYYGWEIKRLYSKENLRTLRMFYFRKQGVNRQVLQDELFDRMFEKMRKDALKKRKNGKSTNREHSL